MSAIKKSKQDGARRGRPSRLSPSASVATVAAYIVGLPGGIHHLGQIIAQFEDKALPARIGGLPNPDHKAWMYRAKAARSLVEANLGAGFRRDIHGRRVVYRFASRATV